METNIIDSFRDEIGHKIIEDSYDFFSANNIFLKFATIAVSATSVFWLFATQFFKNLGEIGYITVIIQLLSSLSVFSIAFTQLSKNKKIMNLVVFIYDIILIVSTTYLIVEKDMQLLAQVGNGDFRPGVPLAAFYYFLIVVTPFPRLRETLPIFALLLISGFLPTWYEGAEAYSLLDNLILRIFVIGVYIVFYIMNNRLRVEKIRTRNTTRELANASLQDALTCTLNKRALYEYINILSFDRNVKTIGTVIFDIDNFKSYNDSYGHMKGDLALEKVCSVAMEVLNKEKIYLFRYGGEEFVFFIKNATREQLTLIGTKIREEVYNANIIRDDIDAKKITITLGASILDIKRERDVDYVQKADEQLYIGKNNKKNCFVIDNKTYR